MRLYTNEVSAVTGEFLISEVLFSRVMKGLLRFCWVEGKPAVDDFLVEFFFVQFSRSGIFMSVIFLVVCFGLDASRLFL